MGDIDAKILYKTIEINNIVNKIDCVWATYVLVFSSLILIDWKVVLFTCF